MGKAKLKKKERREQSMPSPTVPERPQFQPPLYVDVLLLCVFAAIFLTLNVYSYTQKSATWDEPIHLATGYAALIRHDYRVDPEHPPFLRMWAALPLLAIKNIKLDTTAIDQSNSSQWTSDFVGYCRRFLYTENDADRLLYAGRFMIALLGVLLGVLLFCWAREWLGFWAAAIALIFYTLEPNIAAHSSLVTTDLGVTSFMFGAVYFLWRTCRRYSVPNVIALTVFFTLAIVSKFSALILGPIVALLFAFVVLVGRSLKLSTALRLMGLLALVSFCAIWALYGLRYAPSASSSWLFRLHDDPFALDRTPELARIVSWIDGRHLLPNVFTEGFLLGQAKAQVRSGFLAGDYSRNGWWYYFPFAFLIKTPVALLGTFFVGLILCIKQWSRWGRDTGVFIVLPAVVYMLPAMNSHLNIGLRHILPVYPFVLLLAVAAANHLLMKGRNGRIALAAVLLILGLEFARAYPNNLTFFNALVGGPQNGFKYLTDSNLDWGQDLKPLSAWMRRTGVEHINLAYFGSADPAYYKIDYTYLPGGDSFGPVPETAYPQLPGYVAVSNTILSGVYLNERGRALYRPLLEREPKLTIGNSIKVYWLERTWW